MRGEQRSARRRGRHPSRAGWSARGAAGAGRGRAAAGAEVACTRRAHSKGRRALASRAPALTACSAALARESPPSPRSAPSVSCLMCRCGHVSRTYECCTSLTLEVGPRVTSLQAALARFAAAERLDGDNKWVVLVGLGWSAARGERAVRGLRVCLWTVPTAQGWQVRRVRSVLGRHRPPASASRSQLSFGYGHQPLTIVSCSQTPAGTSATAARATWRQTNRRGWRRRRTACRSASSALRRGGSARSPPSSASPRRRCACDGLASCFTFLTAAAPGGVAEVARLLWLESSRLARLGWGGGGGGTSG